ncbi:hypothetical protein [Demequina sp. NBRC 110057]|uniref:hypothetical protein n=1 Tax=Demequina sp. NBRC 110057 TaxID=1570346 RepID=UPI0009FD464B|nr:hypothetical protein [Demequina sp. NBRC 110057]
MDAVVVFESMWGNTSAIAREIARGYGDGSAAMTTDQADADLVLGARLVVAGSPVHTLGLPTEVSRASAAAKDRPGTLAADTRHLPVREWLTHLPRGPRFYAAFETRIVGPLGHGAATAISRALTGAGYEQLDRPHSFTVTMRPHTETPGAMLLPGQEQHAFEWGIRLRRLLAEVG